VGIGTAIRLAANGATLALGTAFTHAPGIVIGTSAIAVAVMCEAVYAGIVAAPVVRGPLRAAPVPAAPLTWAQFSHFYLPVALPAIRRFTIALALLVTVPMLTAIATPLGNFWFARVSALGAPLVTLASLSLWLAIPMPALSAIQNAYQGALVHGRDTRAV